MQASFCLLATAIASTVFTAGVDVKGHTMSLTARDWSMLFNALAAEERERVQSHNCISGGQHKPVFTAIVKCEMGQCDCGGQ